MILLSTVWSIRCEVGKVCFWRIGLAAAAALAKLHTCDSVNDIEVAVVGRYNNVQTLVFVHQTN